MDNKAIVFPLQKMHRFRLNAYSKYDKLFDGSTEAFSIEINSLQYTQTTQN